MDLCENCKSFDICSAVNKNNKMSCFFFSPTDEFSIKQTKEYSIGYQQGRADEKEAVAKDLVGTFKLESQIRADERAKHTCKYWNEEHQECSISNNTYEQGRKDAIEQMDILGLVNYKASDNPINRKRIIEIDYADCLNPEQIVAVIFEQLKEQENEGYHTLP